MPCRAPPSRGVASSCFAVGSQAAAGGLVPLEDALRHGADGYVKVLFPARSLDFLGLGMPVFGARASPRVLAMHGPTPLS